MMLLSPTSNNYYDSLSQQYPDSFGYILTPRKKGIPRYLSSPVASWAADNDVFGGDFDPGRFIAWLKRLQPYNDNCIFVAAPDVVANDKETLRRFHHWEKSIHGLGYPVALVLQDGMTRRDISWPDLEAVFVGGSTDWKLSDAPLRLLDYAYSLGKWCHVGRINSLKRMFHFWDYADSFDGTAFAIEPDTLIKRFFPQMMWRKHQLRLF